MKCYTTIKGIDLILPIKVKPLKIQSSPWAGASTQWKGSQTAGTEYIASYQGKDHRIYKHRNGKLYLRTYGKVIPVELK